MKYRSTRGNINNTLNSSNAIIQGLASDSGLYVPVKFPKANWKLTNLPELSYQEIAKLVFELFFDDFSNQEITQIVESAYGKQWDDKEIAPLKAKDGNFYLELYHGPTLAFKDIALQALPLLMTQAIKNEQINNKIIILTATSGDTGSASMAGFSNKSGTEVLVFYPEGGVSPVQLKQMLNLPGENLKAFAIKGNFDDAQTEVKHIFNDHSFNQKIKRENCQFSSANSMNIGRLIPQIVYYLYSYGKLVKDKKIKLGDQVNYTVPTGNFGDILAAYYAKKLGLPINKLICASNENNVLTDFFITGKYDRIRPFHLTNAPAMDILVSSNLERLLFDLDNENSQEIREWMSKLNKEGAYQVNKHVLNKMNDIFVAGFATGDEVKQEIRRVYENSFYVIDPHTAVASFVTKKYQKQTNDKTPTIIVSTANPYKFPETVYSALTKKEVDRTTPTLNQLHNLLEDELPPTVKKLFEVQNTHETCITISEMRDVILKNLDLN